MKQLRKLRTASGYTQEDLAKMLKVSQQTIARWEAGKAEPNIAALRDIAVIFGTSVDDLLEIQKDTTAKITTNRYHIFAGQASDGFWGYLGLLLPGDEKTKWYPITLGEANRLSSHLSDRTADKHGWLVASTLNNRMLVFAISAIKRIWLLDDNIEIPKIDWDTSWDLIERCSPEIYRALEEYFYGCEEEYKTKYSENLREIVKDIVKERKLDEEKLGSWVLDTHIHFIDGTSTSYDVEYTHLESLVFSVELEENLSVFRLDDLEGREFYFPTASVRLIDIPLLQYQKGCKETYKEEMEEED